MGTLGILYMLWGFVSVIGFPLSVGWLLYKRQKLGETVSEREKALRRESLRKARILACVCLLLLLTFFLVSVLFLSEKPEPL